MKELLSAIIQDSQFAKHLESGKFPGLFGSLKSAVIAALSEKYKKILLVTSSTEEANWFKQEVSLYDKNSIPSIFPTPDTLPGEGDPSPEIAGQRLKVLNSFRLNDKFICVAPIRAAMYKTSSASLSSVELKAKDTLDLQKFIEKLISFGYKRLPAVGERGEFSVRGGILDIFPSNSDEPYRLELFGDDIDSIRIFDPVSQRSKKNIQSFSIFQKNESRDANIFSVIPSDVLVVFDEEDILKSIADRFIKDAFIFSSEKNEISDFGRILEDVVKFKKVQLSSFVAPNEEQMFLSPKSYVKELDSLSALSKNTIIVSQHSSRFPGLKATIGQLRGGFEFQNFLVLSDRELFGIEPVRARVHGKKSEGVGDEIRADFAVGDFVVHEDYGVGVFRGLQQIEEGDYALIEFADGDKLFVPPNLMGKLEKYSSAEGYAPKLSKMGGSSWANLKSKIRKSVKDLTKDLLALYAERKKASKEPFPPDDAWQKELEDSFPYDETEDQIRAINDIKKDLESTLPMDRLLCGDVGYGKTEVALRAIVKVASAGKQVAVLVPTTILAEQHYHNFKERLSSFPFRVASLSRFRSKAEQLQIVERLKLGEVDIVVGTHRLLSKDIGFKDLGMLVIDEEHRFGVAHKEKLKKLKKNIDVLSMTATPIPRTLYFSLSGARDLSLIQTPPADRSPVKTFVSQFNPTLIGEIILRELDRGGQIFFVHNFIESIDNLASLIKKLIPEVRVAVAHGRMHESRLEKVMDDFMDRKYDVLLSTSIIESGLDIPNANTIIIDKADRLGLAQLYQMRGRVGRSPVKAYAYLLYHPQEVQTTTSLSRLQAIQEFTSLGSGYKLALRDMEIRGAGNLLGAQQHGHILSVGFDLYCELLDEAVKEVKGIKEPTPRQVLIEIKEEAYLPSDYVEDEQQRIALYRKLNLLGTEKELQNFIDELRDRFGKISAPCNKLFEIVKLRIKAIQLGIKSIRGDSTIYIDWINGKGKQLKVDPSNRIKQIMTFLLDLSA